MEGEVNTHDLADVEQLCRRLVVFDRVDLLRRAHQCGAADRRRGRPTVRDLRVVEPSIEDVVRTLYTSGEAPGTPGTSPTMVSGSSKSTNRGATP